MRVDARSICQKFYTGSQMNSTWLVETLQYVLSTFLLLNSLFFCSCSLGFYGGLTSLLFSLSESLAVGCL